MMRIYRLFLAVLLLGGCNTGERAYTGLLRIHTAEQYQALVRAQGAAFQRLYPGVQVRVVPSTAREAFVALAQDNTDMVLVDRPANAEELAALKAARREPTEVPIGTDALIFVTGAGSTLREVTLEEVRERFRAGEATVATGLNSGANELLARRYLGFSGGVQPARRAATQGDVPALVGPGDLGLMSMSALAGSRRRQVQVLAVRTDSGLVAPSPLAVYQAEYPLPMPVSYYASTMAGDLASGFLSFARSTYGQKLVQRAGLAPLAVPSRPIQLRP